MTAKVHAEIQDEIEKQSSEVEEEEKEEQLVIDDEEDHDFEDGQKMVTEQF